MTTERAALDLSGLSVGPSQVWGAVRLVPLLRERPVTDLRLHPHLYGEPVDTVAVEPRVNYHAYIPHAFVAGWSGDGTPVAAYGTQVVEATGSGGPDGIGLHTVRRLARRVDRRRLRFLPLHLALEGYLALHFGGPTIAWQEWSRRAVTRGLSPRVEAGYTGAMVPGLEDALRVFEIHPDQCGMVLYVADALAGAMVVGHPDDYRALHPTLLTDLYGELIHHYATLYPAVPEFRADLDGAGVDTVADLRARIATARRDWSDLHAQLAGGLLGVQRRTVERVYRMGGFTLSRFLPAFDPDAENHLGETITDRAGRLVYLKTFRLSAAQVRRGHLLSHLAARDWDLDATAGALGTDRHGLVVRLDNAGFGYLLRADILAACRNRARRPR